MCCKIVVYIRAVIENKNHDMCMCIGVRVVTTQGIDIIWYDIEIQQQMYNWQTVIAHASIRTQEVEKHYEIDACTLGNWRMRAS
jgi:hypothetical protein